MNRDTLTSGESFSLSCLCYFSMLSDSPGNQDWTVFLLTSLHPVSANDSQAACPPLQHRVGFTRRLWGSPLTPEAVFSNSHLFFSDSVSSLHPSTDCTKNNGLFSCASAALRGLWLGSAAGLRFQPHVLHSNQKSQPWQYGRIAEGDTERKSTSRGEEGGED